MEQYEFAQIKDDHFRMNFMRNHVIGIKYTDTDRGGYYSILTDQGTFTASTLNDGIDSAMRHRLQYPSLRFPIDRAVFWKR